MASVLVLARARHDEPAARVHGGCSSADDERRRHPVCLNHRLQKAQQSGQARREVHQVLDLNTQGVARLEKASSAVKEGAVPNFVSKNYSFPRHHPSPTPGASRRHRTALLPVSESRLAATRVSNSPSGINEADTAPRWPQRAAFHYILVIIGRPAPRRGGMPVRSPLVSRGIADDCRSLSHTSEHYRVVAKNVQDRPAPTRKQSVTRRPICPYRVTTVSRTAFSATSRPPRQSNSPELPQKFGAYLSG